VPCVAHLLSDRREKGPYGLNDGLHGEKGAAWWTHAATGAEEQIGGRVRIEPQPGDRLRIRTPGGGGYGPPARAGGLLGRLFGGRRGSSP